MNDPVRLDRVVVSASDLRRSTTFYAKVLGLRRRPIDADPDQAGWTNAPLWEAGEGVALSFKPVDGDRSPSGLGDTPAAALVFSAAQAGLRDWARRLRDFGVPVEGRARAFGREQLCFADPDGLGLGAMGANGVRWPARVAPDITALHAVELRAHAEPERVKAMIQILGYRLIAREGPVDRFQSTAGAVLIDVLNAPSWRPAAARCGQLERLVLEVADQPSLLSITSAARSLQFEARVAAEGVVIDLLPHCGLKIELR